VRPAGVEPATTSLEGSFASTRQHTPGGTKPQQAPLLNGLVHHEATGEYNGTHWQP